MFEICAEKFANNFTSVKELFTTFNKILPNGLVDAAVFYGEL